MGASIPIIGTSPVSSSNPMPVKGLMNVPNIPANFEMTQVDNSAVNNQPLYQGFSLPGTASSAAAFAIKKHFYDTNGNWSSAQWATVTSNVPGTTNIWDNRASLTYS